MILPLRLALTLGAAALLPSVARAVPLPRPASQNIEKRGAVALGLGAPLQKPPRLDAALSDWNKATRLDHFYRVGGEGEALSGLPLSPTQARLAWDEKNLYVAFICGEPSRYAWAAPSGDDPNAALNHPDRVELLVRPSWKEEKFWRFAVARDGSFAARASAQSAPLRSQDDGGAVAEPTPNAELAEFAARVVPFEGGWTAALTLPWSVIGGRPEDSFGLNVARFRHQSGEYLSPLALDATFYPPGPNPAPNAFLEAHFGGARGVTSAGAGLATLPSGIRFWNRPAVLSPPTRAERLQLWELQQSLAAAPTTAQNFAARVDLANRFINALLLEGFYFDSANVSWNPGRALQEPRPARAQINRLLRAGDEEGARRALDGFLSGLDVIARHWWADGSPGNVRGDAWTPFSGPLRVEIEDRALLLQGGAGARPLALRLSLPSTGGVRLHAQTGAAPALGSIEPPSHLPLTAQREKNGIVRAKFDGGSVAVASSPWRVTVFDGAGREKWHLQEGDLRFRFEGERVAAVDWSQPLAPRENVWGFGEWPQRFGLRGEVLTLWQQESWSSLNGGLLNQSYKTIPLFHSSQSASVFINTRTRLRADIGQQNPDRLRLTALGPVFDLFVWPGAPLDNLQRYADLTGKPWMPPRWAFQVWAGGGHLRWARGPLKNAVDEQIGVMLRFADLDIPHSALYAEGGSSSDPRLYAAMEPLGVRVLTWNRNQVSASLLREVPENERPVLRRPDGSIYTVKGHLASQFPYLDWSHPRAMELWRQSWRRRLDLGVAGSMIDFGDWVPEDAHANDGTRGDWLHNAYALDYHRAAHEVFREKRGQDFILFARQAAPGSQKYVAAFAGDYLTNFKGMRAALRAGLNFTSSGFSTWSVELGGYSGGAPDRETYLRWVQWSAFTPLMRSHGQTPREPWEYGPDAVRVYKRMAWTRENLLPAIHSYALEANRSGVPMLRALPLIYPDESRVQNVDDQYLFGPDLLVAPMAQPGTARRVTFPSGRWVHLWSGTAHAGAQTGEIGAPLDEIPVFLREGALVPVEMAPSLKWGDSMTAGRVAALVVTPPQRVERREWQSGEATLEATSAPMAGGFSVTLPKNGPRVLLIYGANVASATFVGRDGRLDVLPLPLQREGGRIVVRVPDDALQVRVFAAEIAEAK